ncbi:DUF4192 family protein [Microbacterium amylolyticum]|uniref:DUF4192 domain-containing protein n=1 Tax=Microbacterium amylolyticum TaxID=936337 RepID=A0ABS4ZGN9_9MICO|nr:DUF4192 family protein [Microbacterium amylolyticum]MBP2436382.1 hypothetical protein [Microbacterium amylolyticum]
MTHVIRSDSSAHFLATVPLLAGFTPRESLVIVPLAAGRTCGVLRVDLPEPADIARTAATAIGSICRVAGADAIAVIVYSDGPLRDGAGVIYEELVDAVAECAHACGLTVEDEICVASDGWCSYADGSSRPLQDIIHERGSLPRMPSHDQAEGTALPAVSPGARVRVAEALGTYTRTADAIERRRGAAARGTPIVAGSADLDARAAARLDEVLPDLAGFFDSVLSCDPDRLTSDDAALLLCLILSPPTRDLAITTWCGGPDEGRLIEEWQSRWERDRSLPPETPLRLAGEGVRPDVERLRRARHLARRLAALAPDAHVHVPLTLCGWLSWGMGNATHAGLYIARALQAEPEYGLAGIVQSLLDAGVLPGWVFDPAGACLI